MNTIKNVGIVCCSNGQSVSNKENILKLDNILRNKGFIPVYSDYIYERDSVYSGTAEERAEALMNFYKDEEISAIYDISGGDIANEILTYLNYDIIKKSNKKFWGYSDLTTVINAIYKKTGRPSVLYQIKNLVYDKYGDLNDLFNFNYEFIQGDSMEGVVVGGNIRCFLKLAGTEYFPDVKDKILLLEALGGDVPQMITYLNQLKQMGVFEKLTGILLGTFSTMEKNNSTPGMTELVIKYAGNKIPLAKTYEIGHGADSKAIAIGEKILLKSHNKN